MLLLAVGVAMIIGAALADPVAQDPSYHLFSDQRSFAGVPNFLNVMSNLPFLFVGAWGLVFVMRHGDSVAPEMKLAWIIFFAGITLTTFGSGYYHLRPANEPLVWDRLPMTIGFMSLVAILVAEYGSARIGKALLVPLLLVGFASVMYWSYTEAHGVGDLRPYAIVQFLPILLIPITLLLFPARSDLGRYVWVMIGFYLAAKFFETFDGNIYAAGELISGHSIKHIVASLAPASLLYGLMQRHRGGYR
jgi:hypothetical protein